MIKNVINWLILTSDYMVMMSIQSVIDNLSETEVICHLIFLNST